MRLKRITAASATLAALTLGPAAAAHADASSLTSINHIVVIYEENHSFDNLFGQWGSVNGQPVNGLSAGTGHNSQVGQDGASLSCLDQIDVNLQHATNPAVPTPTCSDTHHITGGTPGSFTSSFTNDPFDINTYIPPSATTCSKTNGSNDVPINTGNPGGCTHDIVHRFYQEQFQIDGGKQDRYVQGSDAAGLTMGYYETQNTPIFQYLNNTGPYAGGSAPNYVVDDNFFQGAFGGSFANHQALVAAQLPIYTGADKSGTTSGCSTGSTNCDLHSVVDGNGMPNQYTPATGTNPYSYPYYKATASVADNPLSEAATGGSCSPTFAAATSATAPGGTLCGDYAINTIQPSTQPYSPGTAIGKRLPLLTNDNIGDEMTKSNVSWAWYSGGWANAAGMNGSDANHPLSAGWTAGGGPNCADANVNSSATYPYCPDALFQFHHQPFGYYANYADGTPGRAAHLKDELDLINEPDASNPSNTGAYTMHTTLPSVAFIKPIGEENEHPGYASDSAGESHLVKLIQGLLGPTNPDAASTMVVVTYDEFGGQWDHVSPPGTTGANSSAPHDAFGPGTRIPALVISPALSQSGVDHTEHDTVSILSTIENRFGVGHVAAESGSSVTALRDASGNDLSSAFTSLPANTPEVPYAALLPALGAVILGGGTLLARRRRTATAA